MSNGLTAGFTDDLTDGFTDGFTDDLTGFTCCLIGLTGSFAVGFTKGAGLRGGGMGFWGKADCVNLPGLSMSFFAGGGIAFTSSS
jgi:hypothetical protein